MKLIPVVNKVCDRCGGETRRKMTRSYGSGFVWWCDACDTSWRPPCCDVRFRFKAHLIDEDDPGFENVIRLIEDQP